MAQVALPPHMPSAMQRLPRDEVGRPIPKFVGMLNGKPDFRVADPDWLMQATARQLCFTCGEPLRRATAVSKDRLGTFAVGPMCVVNCVSAEPPHHPECAAWSVRACPFMVNPNRTRREAGLPHSLQEGTPGLAIERNPGCVALVVAHRYKAEIHDRGLLFRFEPVSVEWVCEGREATADEVLASIDSGMPALFEACEMDVEAGNGNPWPMLAESTARCLKWVPGDAADYANIMRALGAAQV